MKDSQNAAGPRFPGAYTTEEMLDEAVASCAPGAGRCGTFGPKRFGRDSSTQSWMRRSSEADIQEESSCLIQMKSDPLNRSTMRWFSEQGVYGKLLSSAVRDWDKRLRALPFASACSTARSPRRSPSSASVNSRSRGTSSLFLTVDRSLSMGPRCGAQPSPRSSAAICDRMRRTRSP